MHRAAEDAKETEDRPCSYSGVLLVGACLVLGLVLALEGYRCAMNAILFPPDADRTLSRGRSIYVALFQHAMSAPSNEVNDDSAAWPRYGAPVERYAFTNSTDLFVYMVTSGVLKVGFEFYGAPGMPTARGLDHEGFGSENNAWCVVADVASLPDKAPVIFTANIRAETLAELTGPIWNTMSDHPPLGTHGAYVITMGGSSFALEGRNLGTWEDLVGDLSGFTNRVLRP